MSARRPGLGDLAVTAACALAEVLFGERSGGVGADGDSPRVRLVDAHAVISGRLDLWSGWTNLTLDVKGLVGRLLRIRHNELASRGPFVEAAHRLFSSPEAAYAIPDGVLLYEAEEVRPVHGQPPLELAKRIVATMEVEHAQRRRPLPCAGSGVWTFGWPDRSTVLIPKGFKAPQVEPIEIVTAERVGDISLAHRDLIEIATELDERHGGQPWRAEVVARLLGGLTDCSGGPVDRLVAMAGTVELLNAPTGVGKSVLTQVVAIALCRAGIPVTLVVSDIDTAQSLHDSLMADIEKLDWQRPRPTCALLISPHRMHEKALAAATRERWDRVDKLSYGCALSALVQDGRPPEPGDEPCRKLRPHDSSGPRRNGDAATDGPHSCPLRGICDRHRPAREAGTADIIVTYHHYFAGGQVPLPARVDGEEYDCVSVMELVMRRCPVVLVDEIDLFQSNLVESGSEQVTLAAKGPSPGSLPLAQIEQDRARMLAASDRRLLPPLLRARFLSEQFLNYVLDGELSLDNAGRSSSGWHVPGGNDRMLLERLWGVSMEEAADRRAYLELNEMFPTATSSSRWNFRLTWTGFGSRSPSR